MQREISKRLEMTHFLTGEARSIDTTLCDQVYQEITADRLFCPGAPVSSANKTDHHDITEILLNVALNTLIL